MLGDLLGAPILTIRDVLSELNNSASHEAAVSLKVFYSFIVFQYASCSRRYIYHLIWNTYRKIYSPCPQGAHHLAISFYRLFHVGVADSHCSRAKMICWQENRASLTFFRAGIKKKSKFYNLVDKRLFTRKPLGPTTEVVKV